MPTIFALATALTLMATPHDPFPEEAPAWNPPEAEVVVLGGVGQPEDTHRLLEALNAEGQLIYRRLTLDAGALEPCLALSDQFEPTPQRRACIRDAFPTASPTPPVVVLVVGMTDARGAWQRMECIGPERESYNPHIYVQDFDHPRPDIAGPVRDAVLACIGAALVSD
jgi:hypothetical protein